MGWSWYFADRLSFTPNPLDFGKIRLGTSKSLDITITNNSDADVNLTESKIMLGTYFTISNGGIPPEVIIPAKGSRTIQITYNGTRSIVRDLNRSWSLCWYDYFRWNSTIWDREVRTKHDLRLCEVYVSIRIIRDRDIKRLTGSEPDLSKVQRIWCEWKSVGKVPASPHHSCNNSMLMQVFMERNPRGDSIVTSYWLLVTPFK